MCLSLSATTISTRIKSGASAAADLQTPPGSSWGWREVRHPVLWKTSRTGLQIVRYFQELILRAQFLHLLISRTALNFFMVTSAPCDKQKPSAKIHTWSYELPLHQNHIYVDLPPPPISLKAFPRAIENAVCRAAVLNLPQIKLNLQPSCWASFLSQHHLPFSLPLLHSNPGTWGSEQYRTHSDFTSSLSWLMPRRTWVLNWLFKQKYRFSWPD